jgi:hypothetical protein
LLLQAAVAVAAFKTLVEEALRVVAQEGIARQ